MEVIVFALLIISLFGYCAFFINIRLCKPSHAPLYTMCIVGSLASIGAMLRLLLPFTYALYSIGIVLLIVSIIMSIVNRSIKDLINKLLDPGLIIFFVLSLLFFYLCRGVLSYSHDEFSHWALHPSYLLMTDRLPPNANVVPFYTLPPIASVIEYYFARFLKYQEGMLYYGQIMFLISTLVTVCSNVDRKKVLRVLLYFFLGFIILIKYCTFDFYNLYTDTIMALLSGAAFVVYMQSDKTPKDILKISPVIFAIPLIRESSPTFAIFTVLLMLADQIAVNGFKFKAKDAKDFIRKNKEILSVICLFAVIALSISAWNVYLGSIETDNIYHMKTTGSHKNFQETYVYAVAFFEQMSYTSVGSYLGPFKFLSMIPSIYIIQILLLSFAYFMLEYKKESKIKRQLVAYGIAMTFIYIAFIVGLMYTYLNRFGPEEADAFASMSRYMSSLAIFTIFTTVNVIIAVIAKTKSNMIRKILLFTLTVMLFVNVVSTTTKRMDLYFNRVHSYIGIRYHIYEPLSHYRGQFAEDEKVFVIAQGLDEGITPYVYHFELMANTNDHYYHFDDDTNNFSQQRLSEIIQKYEFDYLINVSTDDYFIDKYGSLFDKISQEVTLYEVTPDSEYLFTAID